MMAKLSRFMCSRRTSPRPLLTVSSGVAASMRGPGMSPLLMALRMTMSSRDLADAMELMLVNP